VRWQRSVLAAALTAFAVAAYGTADGWTASKATGPLSPACTHRASIRVPAERWFAAGRVLAPAGTRSIRLCRSKRAAIVARDYWSLLARSPLGPRYSPVLLWDGRRLLELGGAKSAFGEAIRDTDAAYDPSQRSWRSVAAAPARVRPLNAGAVWTGRKVFVFGGVLGPSQHVANCCVAGLYDPATNRWRVTGKSPIGPLEEGTAVWTGHKVIVAGVPPWPPQRLEAASYDPASDKWALIDPPVRSCHPPLGVAMVATHDGVLLWSLWGLGARSPRPLCGQSGVDVFRFESGGWRDVTGHWPQNQTVDDPVFTGTKILLAPNQIWCGLCSHPPPFDDHGYQVDPNTLRITRIPHGPLDDLNPQIVWTGSAEISLDFGGYESGPGKPVLPGDIAIWNPRTRKWVRGPRAPTGTIAAPAVWGGSRLFALAPDGILTSFGS
jgi:hypothetical protein